MKLLPILNFVAAALAASRTTAPSGCLVVRKSPSSGQYGTVQAAVNALSTSSTSSQCIFIDQGTYTEQVLVPTRKAQLSIYGYTTDTTGYAQNKVTITGKKSQADGLGNDETAPLRVKSPNFKLYNVNVANTYGKGSQAVALSAYADSGYYGCAFTGFQDTVLSNVGYQLYSSCLIQGATDFIFGQQASSWFEKCDIRVVSNSIGYITGMNLLQSPSFGESNKGQRTDVTLRVASRITSSTTATLLLHPETPSLTARTISAVPGERMPVLSSKRHPCLLSSTLPDGRSGTLMIRELAMCFLESTATLAQAHLAVGRLFRLSSLLRCLSLPS